MSLNMRSYVSSRVLGNSLSKCRTLGAKQCRRASSWQNTHLNLFKTVNIIQISQLEWQCPYIPFAPAESVSITSFLSSLHFWIRMTHRCDIADNILPLSTLLMKRYTAGC